MQTKASREDLPLNYFLLVFVLSVPFWLIGGNKLPLPVNLPASSLMFISPFIAALILMYRRCGSGGVKELVKKTFDPQRITNKIWYAPILLLMPSIYFLSYAIMRLMGMPLPDPKIPLQMVPVFFLMFFPAAAAEETGWMGYSFDPMQNRWGALKASLILGFVWAIWHIVPDVQGRHTAKWIVWHRIGTVALRILIGWIYNRTGKSVLAASLFHTMDSVSWSLFPNYGSHYNPFFTSIISGLTAIVVILAGRPKKFALNKHARSRWL